MNETRVAVLNVAQEFVQTRGYNAFSFRDLAARVQIKTASIHYYFPTKADLCRALIERQREQVAQVFEAIDASGLDALGKLHRYVGVFEETLATGNRMCLCGMLAADFATLEPDIIHELRRSFDDHEVWLTRVLHEGRTAGLVRCDEIERDQARSLLVALEGAILLARAYEEPDRFEVAARQLLTRLATNPQG